MIVYTQSRLVLVQTVGETPAGELLEKYAPDRGYHVDLGTDSPTVFAALAKVVPGIGATDRPVSALARWARGLTEATWLVVEGYEKVTSVETDTNLAWLLRQSEYLNAVIFGSGFTTLDGPAVATHLPTSKVRVVGELDLPGRTDSEQLLLSALRITGGSTVAGVAAGLPLTPQQIGGLLETLQQDGLVERDWLSSTARYRVVSDLEEQTQELVARLWNKDQMDTILLAHTKLLLRSEPAVAIRRFLDLGDLGRAEAALRQRYDQPIHLDAEMMDRLRDLPVAELRGHPMLLLAHLTGQRRSGSLDGDALRELADLVRQDSSLELAEDSVANVGALTALMVSHRLLGNIEEALTCARELEVAVNSRHREGTDAARPDLLVEVAVTGLLSGDTQLAIRSAHAVLHAASTVAYSEDAAAAHALLSTIYSLGVKIEDAEYHLQRATAMLDDRAPQNPRTTLMMGLAGMLRDGPVPGSNWQQNIPLLETTSPQREEWGLMLVAESIGIRTTRGPARALQQLQARLSGESAVFLLNEYLRARVQVRVADLAIYAGLHATAKLALETVPDRFEFKGTSEARLALFQGDPGHALELANAGVAHLHGHYAPRYRLIAALALYELGATADAVQMLLEAVRGQSDTQISYAFASVPNELLIQVVRELPAADKRRLEALHAAMPPTLRPERPKNLSNMEVQVLGLLAAGHSSTEMAEELGISRNTVKTHLSNIYTKWSVNGRFEALARGRQLGVLR